MHKIISIIFLIVFIILPVFSNSQTCTLCKFEVLQVDKYRVNGYYEPLNNIDPIIKVAFNSFREKNSDKVIELLNNGYNHYQVCKKLYLC